MSASFKGRLLHIHVAQAASYEMEELDEAHLVAGRGIEGDRYFFGTGTYSAKPDFREVTLIEIEALQALARNDPPMQSGPITLTPADHRRNLTTESIPLNHLVGCRFRVGATILRGGRLNFPCKYLEQSSGCPCFCRSTIDPASTAPSSWGDHSQGRSDRAAVKASTCRYDRPLDHEDERRRRHARDRDGFVFTFRHPRRERLPRRNREPTSISTCPKEKSANTLFAAIRRMTRSIASR